MRQLRNFASLMIDRRVPLLSSKLAFLAVVGGYILFPVDLLPDILPLVGIVDDGTVMLTALALFTRYARGHIERAEEVDDKQIE